MSQRSAKQIPRLRPAILLGRRVDFFPADHWLRLCPGWPPAAGWWRDHNSNECVLAALVPAQSQCLAALLHIRREPWTLGHVEARAAEACEALDWTLQLLP
ncbi:MAG: hypothetical protein OXC53_12775, partial [Rhodobacteraceae bacterium]|nr:hypothetical protein [Paracoccaceae bacterium]